MPSSIHDYNFEFENVKIDISGIKAGIVISSFDCKIRPNAIYVRPNETLGKFTYIYYTPSPSLTRSGFISQYSEEFFEKFNESDRSFQISEDSYETPLPVPKEFYEQPWGYTEDSLATRKQLAKHIYYYIKDTDLCDDDAEVIPTSSEKGEVLRRLFHMKKDEELKISELRTRINELYKSEKITGILCGIPFSVDNSVLKFGFIEMVETSETRKSFISFLRKMNDMLNQLENIIAIQNLNLYVQMVYVNNVNKTTYDKVSMYCKNFYKSEYANDEYKKRYVDALLKYGTI